MRVRRAHGPAQSYVTHRPIARHGTRSETKVSPISPLSAECWHVLTPCRDLLPGISQVGSILIFCVGVNLVRPGTFRTANLLPAVMIAAAIWSL